MSRRGRAIRWILSVLLLALGLSVTWAWGRVGQMAESLPGPVLPEPVPLYAAWQPVGSDAAVLYQSPDEGSTWKPLAVPAGVTPAVWAGDGGNRVAVATTGGALLRSEDEGSHWSVVTEELSIRSLAWGNSGDLYVGTDGGGIYRQVSRGVLASLSGGPSGQGTESVLALALAEGRLFAATSNALFVSDDDGMTWMATAAPPARISAMAALSRDTVLLGTETQGLFRSNDAGQTWQLTEVGLGPAAGLSVAVTALRADPGEAGVAYAAIGYRVGGTELHFSAAGAFATLDGGQSWQALAGPRFPEASRASGLVVAPGRPLFAQAVTANGLEAYAPDVDSALAALQGPDPQQRVTAARTLGLAGAQEAASALLAALDDENLAVSLAAGDALGRVSIPATIPGLLVALDHPHQQVRLGAARALGGMGVDAAVAPLRRMLMSDSPTEVSIAGESLGQIASPQAIDALLAALVDPAATSRRQAALAGLEAAGEAAVGPLSEMLASTDVSVRRNGAQALGWTASPSATSALLGLLQDADEGVRSQAAWALGEISSSVGIPLDPQVRTALTRVEKRDPVADVRAQAEWALSQLASEPVVRSGWVVAWASALNQLQMLRWVVLAFSLMGAARMAVGIRQPLPVLQAFHRGQR